VRLFERARSGAEAAGGSRALVRQCLHAALDGDLADVEALLLRIVRADGDDVEAYRALGRVCRDRGDVARAIGIHRALVLRRDLTPAQRVDALTDLGESLRAAGALRRATAAFEEALAHAPRSLRALRGLEAVLVERGSAARALVVTRRRARAEGRRDRPAEAQRLAAYASALRGEGRIDAACRVARRAVRRDPDAVDVRLVAGDLEAARERSERAHARLGRRDAWRAWLEARIERVPDDGAAWLALGRALAEADDRDAGVSMLRRLLRGRPYEVPGRVALGRLLVGDGAERAGLEAIKAYAELLDVLAARIGAAGEREPEAASRVAAVSEEPVDAGRTEGARA